MGIPYVEADFTLNKSQTKGKKRSLSADLRLKAATKFKPTYDHFARVYNDKLPESWRRDIAAVERLHATAASPASGA
jgi:hypothetical protein